MHELAGAYKFEARHSKGPSTFFAAIDGHKGRVRAIGDEGVAIVEAHRAVTYERDICVRCGHVIERQIINEKAEVQA